jgi:hypothetical protein
MGEMSAAMTTRPGGGVVDLTPVLARGVFLMAFSHSFTPRWMAFSLAPVIYSISIDPVTAGL